MATASLYLTAPQSVYGRMENVQVQEINMPSELLKLFQGLLVSREKRQVTNWSIKVGLGFVDKLRGKSLKFWIHRIPR